MSEIRSKQIEQAYSDGAILKHDNRRATKNAAKRNGEVIMEKIKSFLNVEGAKNTKSIEYYKRIIEKRATQFNDIDCGVFALFYVECCVNEIVVKPV